jgi:tetratricopeptide (TPR) repeat protein
MWAPYLGDCKGNLRSRHQEEKMRFSGLPAWVIALFVVAGPILASPAVAADADICAKASGDEAIAACTRAISSGRVQGRELALVYFNRGIEYQTKGDDDRAIADFTAAIRLDPKHAKSYNSRGNAYHAKGDDDRAIADYTAAIRLDPKDAYTYNNRGSAYKGKGDLDRAIADYSETIRLNPSLDKAYSSRGTAYLYSGNPAKALADVSQASELDPKSAYYALWVDIVGQRNNVPSRLSQAVSKLDMTAWPAPLIRLFLGQMTPAAALAAADDPDVTRKRSMVCDVGFYGGELALRAGAKDDAAGLFRLAVANCQHNFVEWFAASAELKALGGAAAGDADQCTRQNDPDARVAACTRILQGGSETAPHRAAAFNNRGRAYQAKDDLDRAIADFNETIRLDAKYALAYYAQYAVARYARGVRYQIKGDGDRAIADFDEAIRLDPKNARAFNIRGYAYRASGDLDRAIADYDEAIRLDPKFGVAYSGRGAAYQNKGDLDRAATDFDEAVRHDPKYAFAHFGRAVVYQAKGDLDTAIADYDEAIQLDPKNAQAFNNRGDAYRAKCDFDRAIADYDEAIRLNPKLASAYNGRGLAKQAKGDAAGGDADIALAKQM